MSKSRYPISAVTAAISAALNPGLAAAQQEDDDDEQYALEEIIVTATKRSESVQDIPATVQAITQESLAAMGAKTMEDYARFVPSVNVVTYGPNSSTVVFRGAITGTSYISQSTSSVPYAQRASAARADSERRWTAWRKTSRPFIRRWPVDWVDEGPPSTQSWS